jgi:hypothetical protein
VRELAVREDDGRAIVSFLLDQVRGRATETWFVVDIWKGDRILSRLATRAVVPRRRRAGPASRNRPAAYPHCPT